MYEDRENQSTLYTNSLGKPIQSYTGSKLSQKIVEDRAENLDNELKSYLQTLDEIAAKWADIKKDRDLSSTEQRKYNELLTVYKQMSDFSKNKNKDAETLISLTEDYAKVALDSEKRILEAKIKSGEITEDSMKKQLDYIADFKDTLKTVVKDNKDLAAHIENSEKRLSHLKNTIGKYKESFRDIAMISGLDKVKEQLTGGTGGSLIDIRNKVSSQFGMSNRNEWQSFKNNLIGNQMKLNDNLGKAIFGFGDVKKYMSELSTLGIYDTKMAEAQLQAVLEGNKILGLSTETQAQILKIGKRSGNDALLQEVNDTIATLLNAQIGLSKEQLATMAQQSTGSADLLSYFGNDQAMTQLIEGQALMEKKYGLGTANAAMNILSDLLANGVNSNAYTMLGVSGGNNVLNAAMNGDAAAALQMILEYTQGSGLVRAGSKNPTVASSLGVTSDYITLYKAQLDETADTNSILKALEEKTGQMNELARNFWMPIEEQIGNIMTSVVGMFPFGEYFNIENAFYLASLAEFAINHIEWAKTRAAINRVAMSTGGLGGNNTGIFGKFTNFLSSHAKTFGVLSIIAGSIMAIKDGVEASNNADAYGNKNTIGGKFVSGVQGTIFGDAEGSVGNALKNAVKWGLIGAGIGTFFGGIGAIPGFVIGGLAGLLFGGIAGAIGGNNGLTNAFSNIVNTSNTIGDNKSAKEDAKGSPSGYGNIGGIESNTSSSGAWPWKVTSPFGVKRKYTNTKGELREDVHRGIDLSKANAEGTPMGANLAGTVTRVGTDSDGANYVKIKDDAGYTHLYWHLQQKSPLSAGQRVHAGQFIGLMGSTGNVTGPHLHYGIVNPKGTYINPHSFITQSLFNVASQAPGEAATSKIESPNEILNPTHKLISANTTQVEAVRNSYSRNYGSDEIVSSVNNGFGNLINKLEELSNRQDATEDVLRTIASSSSDAVYRY